MQRSAAGVGAVSQASSSPQCSWLENHEIEISQRNDRSDRSPNDPAPAMLPIAFRNRAALGERARLPRLQNLRRNEDDHPDHTGADKHRLAPNQPRGTAQIEMTDRRHAVSADQNERDTA